MAIADLQSRHRIHALPHRPVWNVSAARPMVTTDCSGKGRRPVSADDVARRRAATRRRAAMSFRRRITGLALLVVVTAAGFLTLGGGMPAVADEVGAAPAHVVLAEGDTVWELVGPYRPDGMAMQTWVRQVIVHNDFEATALPPGTVVRLP